MAIYIKVTVMANIKIQDPYDETTIDEMKDNTFLKCPHELCDENYQYETVDAD